MPEGKGQDPLKALPAPLVEDAFRKGRGRDPLQTLDRTMAGTLGDVLRARYMTHYADFASFPKHGLRFGQIAVDETAKTPYWWDGTQWKTFAGVGPGTVGGLVHYDFVVDAAFAGVDGTSFTLASGQTVRVYKTVQAAVNAADADNAPRTVLLNAGTYSESVTLPATLVHPVTFAGEGRDRVNWGNSAAGDALTIASGTGPFRFHNIRFQAVAGGYSVKGTAANIDAQFSECEFARKVSADFAGSQFFNCDFEAGYQADAGHTPSSVAFMRCTFSGTSTWADAVEIHNFIGCRWAAGADVIVSTGNLNDVRFTDCDFGTSGAAKVAFTKNGGTMSGLVFSNCGFPGAGANGAIYIQSTTGASGNGAYGCTFVHTAASAVAFVKSASVNAQFSVVGCAFKRDGLGNYVEDSAGVSIAGIFQRSVFAGNTPESFAVQLDATSSACLYGGAGMVSGAAAIEARVTLPQRGAGAPAHTAPEGTGYWDTTNAKFYMRGGAGWLLVGPGGGGLSDRIQDADNDTFIDVEVGVNPNFATWGIPATSTIFGKLLKGAESSPRIQLQDDGVALGDGTTLDLYLRRVAAHVLGLYQATASGDALELSTNTPPGAAASNSLRFYAEVFGTGAAAFLKDQSGIKYGPIGMKEQATIFGRGPSGGMEPPGSATWSDSLWGTLAPVGLWTPTGTMSVANDTATRRGRYIEALSGALAGNKAGVESGAMFWANMDAGYLIRFFLPDITNIRFFAGIAAQTLATMVGSDAAGTNHLGIQFSTPRADINWQFTERAAGSQVLTNSGIAASSADPFYIQVITGLVTQMTLMDYRFVPLATRTAGVLSKPAATTLVSIIVGCETETAASRAVRWFHINEHSRSS